MNDDPPVQFMLIGMVQGPEPVIVPRVAALQVPAETETLLVVGVVQPFGTRIVAWEPELKSLPFGAVNVNVNVFPVLLGATAIGLTVMVPSPLAAFPSVNVVPPVLPLCCPLALRKKRTATSWSWTA